ncbi:MAG: hypothetical protein Ta2B_17790 [Termitinemataceae bacterium]|nr:MAG: hypothetical protein Ta2B_17790 [Termitinemataceae bacterium]
MFEGYYEYPPDMRTRVVCSEKQSKITFLNNKPFFVAQVRIDGGVIDDPNITKCDFLVLCEDKKPAKGEKNITNPKFAIFIELKGTDVLHAITQIEKTIEHDAIKLDIATCKLIFAYVVLVNRAPSIETKIQKEIARLVRQKKCLLEVINSNKERNLQDILEILERK